MSIGKWTEKWANENLFPCEYFDQITSTNDLAKEEWDIDDEKFLFITDHQTKGRGRGTNSWKDVQPGSSFLASWSFSLTQAPQPVSTQRAGLALFEACQKNWPKLEWSLKAPNDVFLGSKKVAGLLVEAVSEDESYRWIVGVGMNVQAHPNMDIATSIKSALGHEVSASEWNQFMSTLSMHLESAMNYAGANTLNSSECERIKNALNANPNLKEKIVSVLANGSLQTETKTVNWLDL